MNKLGLLVLIICTAFLILVATGYAQEEKQEPHNWVDPVTKCQYIITPEGGISMRMVDNGVIYMHMGCKPLVDLKKPIK